MSESIVMERYCLECREETEHILHYADGLLKEGRCTKCDSSFSNRVKLLEIYGEKFMERVLTKPLRVAEELLDDLTGTIRSLPERVIKKPFREASRLANILDHEEDSKSVEERPPGISSESSRGS